MLSEQDRKNLINRIQRDELAELTKALVDVPSPTGSEKAIGEFILDWYSRHGIKPVRQEIDPNRINAVGILKGRGEGVSLIAEGSRVVGCSSNSSRGCRQCAHTSGLSARSSQLRKQLWQLSFPGTVSQGVGE